jgi:pyrroloquinoline quinone biosynthesis protein B
MKIRVLGSAAGGGFPQWNCNCSNCDRYRKGTIRARRRTQSSIAVSDQAGNSVLFNASPDILAQLHDWPGAQPARAIRDTAIRAIVLIDSQIDHTTGLLMLREGGTPLRVHCTDPVREDLTTGNPLFNVLSHYCKIDWRPLRFQEGKCEFSALENSSLRFTAYPLKSKAPPYSPHRHDSHTGDTIGVVIEDTQTGRGLFYAPGLGEIEPPLRPLMAAADCLLVDGTFWREDEMSALGIADKPARALGHLPQTGAGGMIETLSSFSKPRKILIHINNTNPILDEDSAERATLTEAGIEVAFDGMEIAL